MPTKRTPVHRQARRYIGTDAVEAFRRMRVADTADEWWSAHNDLHAALGGKPWEWPIVEDPDAQCPYDAGTEAAARWKRERNADAMQLWLDLEAALK